MSRRRSVAVLACVLLLSLCSCGASARQTYMVAMGDGAKMATDVYLPPGKGPFPALLTRTPYGRRGAAIGLAQVGMAVGFAMVFQDMRGRFESEGENLPFIGCGWADHADGADTVAWLLKQEWCDGKVGTMGASACGITQNLLAGAAPPGLCSQYLRVAGLNLFTDAAYIGGAFRKEQSEDWTTSNRFDPKIHQLWSQHTHYDDYWAKFDASTKFAVMNVPAVHVGGWFDTFSQATIDSFLGRQYQGAPGGKGKQKLVMGPWCHMGWLLGGRQGDLTFPRSRFPAQYNEVRWFECLLKGKDNGVLNEPAVAYYTMGDTQTPGAPGNQWRYADAWPIPATATPYYLHTGGRLDATKPGAGTAAGAGAAAAAGPATGGFVEYTFDPKVPCPTLGGKNLTIPAGPKNQNRIEARKDVLAFTTDPLAEPVEVTGRVQAKAFVSSSAADTDLSVRLCDVYPDGKSYEIAEGILRLRFREGFSKEVPLEAGKVYEVTVDCWSTSIVFNKGHRIRVLMTSSNFPRFDLNPGTGKVWGEGGDAVRQTNRIFCDAEHPSRVILPVVRNP